MLERRSLRWPITLGVTMIILIVLLTVGWVLLAVFGALENTDRSPLYWTLLTVGTVFLVLVLVGVVLYLSLTVKAINLNRRQSNFIDSVTHELKSPIASLKLYLQTLNRRQVSQQQQEHFYRYMLQDVERLDQLITHLLAAAKLEKESSEEEQVPVQTASLLEQCAAEVCQRHQVPPEVIELDLESALVEARPVDLELIFRNLIDNAVKYAGDEPRVQIQSVLQGEELITWIRDNGRGIPPKLRRKIFGRFVRLGDELEREKPGTGLGLYIVRTLVRRLRGSIRVVEPENGPGTVFEVRLPGRKAIWFDNDNQRIVGAPRLRQRST